MVRLFFLAFLIVFAPNAVAARQVYASYNGPDAIKVGAGGTKLEKNGIEYWTSGAPPRAFRVLGIFTDARKNRWWDGDAVGSGSIARKVKEAGGEAVILLDADTKFVGVTSFFSSSSSYRGSAMTNGNVNGYVSPMGNVSGIVSSSTSMTGETDSSGFGSSMVLNRTTTRLLVVRYLDSDELALLQQQAGADAVASTAILPAPLAGLARAPQGEAVPVNQQAAGPQRRPAKTPSGYCLDVSQGYAGNGTLQRPAITSYAPACWQVTQ